MNPFLFKGSKQGKHIQEPKRAVASVCKAIDKAWSLHDLRRSYVSHAVLLIPYPCVKKLVGHAPNKKDVTDEHYTRIGTESLRPEAQKVADWLADKMGMKTSLLEVVGS
jgi:hypothetical protein